MQLVVTNDDFTHWRKIMETVPISEEERENMKRTITKPILVMEIWLEV